jgi:hypothetical protein
MELLLLILSFVGGVGLYFVDVKRGISAYTKWYNLTHKDPIQDNRKGFIHLQDHTQKAVVATFVAGTFYLISILVGGHIIQDLLNSIMVFIGLVIGFYLAAPVLKFLPGGIKELDELLKKADEVERIIHDAESDVHETPPPAEEQKADESSDPPVKEPDSEPQKDKDWRSGIDDYLNKK